MIDVSSLTLLKGKKALVRGLLTTSHCPGVCQGLPGVRRRCRGSPTSTTRHAPTWSRWRERSMHRCCCQLDLTKVLGPRPNRVRDTSQENGSPRSLPHSIAFAAEGGPPRGGWSTARRRASPGHGALSAGRSWRMAKLAEPLMKNGGALFTMTYYAPDGRGAL